MKYMTFCGGGGKQIVQHVLRSAVSVHVV